MSHNQPSTNGTSAADSAAHVHSASSSSGAPADTVRAGEDKNCPVEGSCQENNSVAPAARDKPTKEHPESHQHHYQVQQRRHQQQAHQQTHRPNPFDAHFANEAGETAHSKPALANHVYDHQYRQHYPAGPAIPTPSHAVASHLQYSIGQPASAKDQRLNHLDDQDHQRQYQRPYQQFRHEATAAGRQSFSSRQHQHDVRYPGLSPRQHYRSYSEYPDVQSRWYHPSYVPDYPPYDGIHFDRPFLRSSPLQPPYPPNHDWSSPTKRNSTSGRSTRSVPHDVPYPRTPEPFPPHHTTSSAATEARYAESRDTRTERQDFAPAAEWRSSTPDRFLYEHGAAADRHFDHYDTSHHLQHPNSAPAKLAYANDWHHRKVQQQYSEYAIANQFPDQSGSPPAGQKAPPRKPSMGLDPYALPQSLVKNEDDAPAEIPQLGTATSDQELAHHRPWKLCTDKTAIGGADADSMSLPGGHAIQVREEDVLCGRGAPVTLHSGNVAFRHLIEQRQAEYLCARRSDKPQIATSILEEVKSRGGRFLKKISGANKSVLNRGAWMLLDDYKAYEKVCQSLREGAPEVRRKIIAKSQASQATPRNQKMQSRKAGSEKENSRNYSHDSSKTEPGRDL